MANALGFEAILILCLEEGNRPRELPPLGRSRQCAVNGPREQACANGHLTENRTEVGVALSAGIETRYTWHYRRFLFFVASVFASRAACSSPMKSTGVPLATADASASASQLVSRMQPCDSDLLTLDGSAVPWMP